MPVGHERINAREQDPNPNIVFIRSLPDFPNHEQALHLLKCLAAQFKPIMKEWGFGVNSLVEYEHNEVFAGRCFNAGEVIELVLRRRDGSFLPYQFLLYVMCHELAHIKEMNHSHYFQKTNKQIRQALSSLRQKGYTGDGFYGRGRTLNPDYAGNDARLGGNEVPTYTCGGALKKVRRRRPRVQNGEGPSKPRRERGSAVNLGTTGRQTAIKKKAGGRVTKKLPGEGRVLGAATSDDDEDGEVMSTKGLRTQSKASRAAREIAATSRLEAEKRAKAIEARLNGGGGAAGAQVKGEDDEDWEFEEEDEEDKPDIKLVEKRFGKGEKDYLREEMRDWELDIDDEDDDEEELTQEDRELIAKIKAKEKKRSQPETQEDSDDDDLIIMEPAKASTSASSSSNKKVKVCHCKMPKALGGIGGKKEEVVKDTVAIKEDDEWIDID